MHTCLEHETHTLLACEPQLLIADEPTTALDVTVQAQILELLADLQQRLKVSVILITHDLGVVAQLCHRVAVMYAGRIIEVGEADSLFASPIHPYTKGLLNATPRLDEVTERMRCIEGVPPNLISPPRGCAFSPRCANADAACAESQCLTTVGGDRQVCCWREVK